MAIANLIQEAVVANGNTTLSDILQFTMLCVCGLVFLPELCLVFEKWRDNLMVFVMDDDGKKNKSDMKDAAINWLALTCGRVGGVITPVYDLIHNKDNLGITLALTGFAATLWGVNQLTKNYHANHHEIKTKDE